MGWTDSLNLGGVAKAISGVDLTPGFNITKEAGGGIPFVSAGNGSTGKAPVASAQPAPAQSAAKPQPQPTPQPAAPISQAPAGGSAAPAPVFNQAGADNTQRTIDQLPALLQAALSTEATRYGNTVNEFNSQEAGQRKTYDTSTVTNQQNYDSNFMDSIRAGIKGLGGLMNLLRGTGAEGGTAEDIARDTVGGVTSSDIRTGADTQKENQTSLDTSLSGFLSDLDRKRRGAEDTRVNNEAAVRRDSNTQLQDLYTKMAGFFGDAGRTGEATNFMNRAGDLTPSIAADSRTVISPYDTAPIAVKAPELTAFAAPTQPETAIAPADGQVGSGIFTMTDRRRKDPNLVTAPAGA